jgi:acetylornithine deacetylase
MSDRSDWIAAQVGREREAAVHTLRALIGVSERGEEPTQQWVAARFAALGCDVDAFRYDPGQLVSAGPIPADAPEGVSESGSARVCVVGRLPGESSERTLLLFAHPDPEPFDGALGWRHTPFGGEVESGRIHGWGVADDLCGVAAMLCTLGAVRAAGLVLSGPLVVASAPSKRGARGIVAALDRGHRAAAALYLHPAESGQGLREIKAVTPGLLRFRVTVSGRAPDTGEPEQTPFHHQAVNAIDKAWVIWQALRELDEIRAATVRHPALDEAVGRSTNIHIAHVRAGDEGRLNRVSESCVLAGSVTFPPGERLEDVQTAVTRALRGACRQDGWLADHPPRLEWLLGAQGAEVGVDQPFFRAVSRAVARTVGQSPRVNAVHASSDIANPILHGGIPTVGIGPRAGGLTQSGGIDEWVDLGEYFQTIETTGRLVVDWCGVR